MVEKPGGKHAAEQYLSLNGSWLLGDRWAPCFASGAWDVLKNDEKRAAYDASANARWNVFLGSLKKIRLDFEMF